MASLINVAQATSRQLDGKPQPDEQVTEADVTDAPKLARLLTRLLAEIAKLKRPHNPRRLVFTDVVVDSTGTTPFRFTHKFGGSVNWWVVGWQGSGGHYNLDEDLSTDKDTLVLVSYSTGTVAICVEERG